MNYNNKYKVISSEDLCIKKFLYAFLRDKGVHFLGKKYKDRYSDKIPITGFCYVCSEFVYHYLGFKNKGYTPMVINFGGHLGTHWFLKKELSIIDVTGEQFGEKYIPYEIGKGCGFLTKNPSNKTKIIYDAFKKNN